MAGSNAPLDRLAPQERGVELLHREIFYTLAEAKVLIEWWRQEYNHKRPHSSLGYRPPAPEAVQVAVGLT